MIDTRAVSVVRGLLSFLCLVVISLIVSLLYLRDVERPYKRGTRFSVPSGYGVNIDHVPPLVAACYVMRVTSDSCPYCRADAAQYERVREIAKNAGCRVFEIGPRAGDIRPREGSDVLQLQYVDMSFGAKLMPFATPQTILLDREGILRWFHQGTLAPADVAVATDSIHRLGVRR